MRKDSSFIHVTVSNMFYWVYLSCTGTMGEEDSPKEVEVCELRNCTGMHDACVAVYRTIINHNEKFESEKTQYFEKKCVKGDTVH